MSVFSRKRPSDGAVLQLHQEAQSEPPFCKRRSREEEVMKRRRRWRTAGGCGENRDPGEDLQRNVGTQNLKREHRTTRTRTEVRTGSVFRTGGEIQSCRPEVRVALIRKTRIQTSVQTSVRTVELTGSKPSQGLILTDQTDPGSTETQLDQRRPTQLGQTRTTESTSEVRSRSQVRSRSRSTSRSTADVVSVQSSETRTSRRSDRILDPESCRGEGCPARIRSTSEGRKTKMRRRTKIHPSVFRGRGQLRLSITPEAGQLVIHIIEARGLMGKSYRSCDSYVKLVVTSDLHRSVTMKTPTVLNKKNPEYNQSFTLCISDDIILNRLLVSVFSRCRQLIGCMSFGIGSLISSSKVITGWFYLLGEEFGWSKHLRVTSQQNKPMRSLEDRPENCADLRRTPDSAPDTDQNHITTSTSTTSTLLNSDTTTGLRDLTNLSLTNLSLTNLSLTSSCPHTLDPTNGNFSSYASTLYVNTNQRQVTRTSSSTTQRLTVNVVRGKDGFGFTICSDCPVRVQAVDSGGPAHQSGLRQGDSVLQLNGLPVETWKCVDLAHAIRSCPSQIVLVVWRGLPELRPGCNALLRPQTHNTTTGRKLLPHPTHSKHGRRRGQRLGVRSSLGALGSLWRDRKEDQEEEEEEQEVTEFSPRTTTLKGTHVTSSHGDNYIILSPVSTGGQLLQPVYHDRNGTIGRLYQTHPSRGQNLLHDPRSSSSQPPFSGHTSTLPPPPSTSSSSAPPSNFGNYQNCTIVQSHLPCSSYGTYVTLAPKTLIFPIFVQPLDLCSPDRTLLMAEEMVLHQADLLPTKVTVLIYSDLLLFTREDEAGRCNVLQSPVYLNTLQLREVASEPLHVYFLQSSQTCWRCLFSLEAFSIEQKVRVSLCLHDNIQLQLVTTETGHAHHQISDLPSDFGLLSLRQSDLLYRPPLLTPPLILPTSAHPPPTPLSVTPSDLPPPLLTPPALPSPPPVLLNPSPLFLHTPPHLLPGPSPHHLSFSPRLPPPLPPRGVQSGRERRSRGGGEDNRGGSLHHMLLLLNGTKDAEFRNLQLRKKTKSLAADVRSRLLFLRQRKNSSGVEGNSLEKALRNNRPSTKEVMRWAESLEALLTNQYGLAVFRHFLRSEFSEENLDFWLAVERFKRTHPLSKMAARAVKIYEEFISTNAARQVNVDSSVRESTNQSLSLGINPASFQLAQDQIFGLMETDSYPRFLRSRLFAQLANQGTQMATESAS
ncbi:regulator of G-protein signaling 3-like [Pagrus major]|uniref:regulator of G-protein signaling 3-like n=1 Tax=Pagrus major TaxID=143350 RepID=UPI003CC858B2